MSIIVEWLNKIWYIHSVEQFKSDRMRDRSRYAIREKTSQIYCKVQNVS